MHKSSCSYMTSNCVDKCDCNQGNPDINVGDIVRRVHNLGCPVWAEFLYKDQPKVFKVTSKSEGGRYVSINGYSQGFNREPFEINFFEKFEVEPVPPCQACLEKDDRFGHTCVQPYNTLDKKPEYTGGSVNYYGVFVSKPTSGGEPYLAECNDIIESLGMNFAEGNALKAIWRRAAHRTLGKKKAGASDDGLYDAEKVVFFGQRLVEQSKVK